jgi:hypothetical protein
MGITSVELERKSFALTPMSIHAAGFRHGPAKNSRDGVLPVVRDSRLRTMEGFGLSKAFSLLL